RYDREIKNVTLDPRVDVFQIILRVATVADDTIGASAFCPTLEPVAACKRIVLVIDQRNSGLLYYLAKEHLMRQRMRYENVVLTRVQEPEHASARPSDGPGISEPDRPQVIDGGLPRG